MDFLPNDPGASGYIGYMFAGPTDMFPALDVFA